jgi:hypothetical protein
MKSIEQLTIKSSNSKYKVLLKKSHSLDFSKRYVIIFDKNLQDYANEYKTSSRCLAYIHLGPSLYTIRFIFKWIIEQGIVSFLAKDLNQIQRR